MNPSEKESILKAGGIASQVIAYARTIVKKGVPLLEIAEKIEGKIIELGGFPAFPVNLSINEIAAHYTPSAEDETLAEGLICVDFGVHVDGFLSDTAFTLDLENSEEDKNLISASEESLNEAIEKIKKDTEISLSEVGQTIQEKIEAKGCRPIVNLTGHSMDQYDLHSGISVLNIKNNTEGCLPSGLYAIEPFSTFENASGKVKDGNSSGIYLLQDNKAIRSPAAREILGYLEENYSTLPFCSRWLVKEFGNKAILALSQLERNGNLHHFPQLVESSGKKVAQAEHTILIDDGKVVVTTG